MPRSLASDPERAGACSNSAENGRFGAPKALALAPTGRGAGRARAAARLGAPTPRSCPGCRRSGRARSGWAGRA
eukprot:7223687-Prymnesium_polylepis.1